MPGHHVTITPGLSLHLIAVWPLLGPPALSLSNRLVPCCAAPCYCQPSISGPTGCPIFCHQRPCRIRAKGATLLASSIRSNTSMLQGNPSPWSKPPPRIISIGSIPSCFRANPPRLPWDTGDPQPALHRCTNRASHKHPPYSGAIIISSGASTSWQKDRRGIDRRHPGPMRRGTNSPVSNDRAAMDYGCSPG